MTNYLRRNKKISPKYFIPVGILLFVIIFPGTLSNLSVFLFGKLFEAKTALTPLQNETIIALKSEVQKLTIENKLLEQKVTLVHRDSVPGIVIATPPSLPFDTLLVRGGENDGVRVGDVVATDRVLLGVVTEVTGDYARASLLSTPGKILHGTIGEDRTPIEITGIGAGAFKTKVAAGVTIKVGDPVMLEGAPDLIIGTVAALLPNSAPSFQDISITIPFSLRSLRLVEMIPEHSFPISF